MISTRRVTAVLPAKLLDESMKVSGKDVTATLIESLELLCRSRAFSKALAMKGELLLDLDLAVSRERDLAG